MALFVVAGISTEQTASRCLPNMDQSGLNFSAVDALSANHSLQFPTNMHLSENMKWLIRLAKLNMR